MNQKASGCLNTAKRGIKIYKYFIHERLPTKYPTHNLYLQLFKEQIIDRLRCQIVNELIKISLDTIGKVCQVS